MDVELFRRLRRQVEELPTGHGRRYPWELRRRIVALARSHQRQGYSGDELAQELSVPWPTLRRWLEAESKMEARDALVPVEVIQPDEARTFRVTTPAGFLVEGLDFCEVIELLVAVGDQVEMDQGLIVLESDKASMEIPSTAAGTVVEILVTEGQELSEGAPVAVIASADAGDAPAAAETLAEEPVAAPASEPSPTARYDDWPPASAGVGNSRHRSVFLCSALPR